MMAQTHRRPRRNNVDVESSDGADNDSDRAKTSSTDGVSSDINEDTTSSSGHEPSAPSTQRRLGQESTAPSNASPLNPSAAASKGGGPRTNRGRSAGSSAQVQPTPATLPSSAETRRDLRRQLATSLAKPNVVIVPQLAADVAFTRNQLRNAFLKLLFYHPFTQAAHLAEKALWTDTTYRVFDVHRVKLAKVDQEIAKLEQADQAGTSTPPSGRQSPSTSSASPSRRGAAPSANSIATKRRALQLECTRIATALRNFLAREETFWKSLAERLAIVFKITEAYAPLAKAGIDVNGPRIPIGPRAEVGEENQPSGLARLPATPAELDPEVLRTSTLPRQRQQLIESMFAIIIFCGDVARYREQFKDVHLSGNDSAASSSPRRNGAAARGGAAARSRVNTRSTRDFSTAILYYDAARLLLPSNGNASNQIAVAAGISSDMLASVYHYYRALCVNHPFMNAQQNLGSQLKKALDAFVHGGGLPAFRERATASRSLAERKRDLSEIFVVLQGWYYHHKNADDLPAISNEFLAHFTSNINGTALPTDLIVRMVVTSLAASWWARLTRKEAKRDASSDGSMARNTELNQLLFVLEISKALFDVVQEQARNALDDSSDASRSYSSQQTATSPANGRSSRPPAMTPAMRRLLPPLRIISKWLKAHLGYLDRNRDLCQEQVTNRANPPTASRVFVDAVGAFWSSFVELVNTLRYAFPYDTLPSLGNVGPTGAQALTLEEDTDLRGFLPTRSGMASKDESQTAAVAAAAANASPVQTRSSLNALAVDFNGEQLMRIADILVDAKVVAESEASPIVFDDEHNIFVVDSEELRAKRQARLDAEQQRQREQQQQQELASRQRQRSDSLVSSIASDATEDVVDLAMRAVQERSQRVFEGDESVTTASDDHTDNSVDEDDEDSDDEEDEILIPSALFPKRQDRRKTINQAEEQRVRAAAPVADGDSVQGALGMENLAQTLPSVPSVAQPAPPAEPSGGSRTAQDLFLQMLNGRPAAAASAANAASPSMGANRWLGGGGVIEGGVMPHDGLNQRTSGGGSGQTSGTVSPHYHHHHQQHWQQSSYRDHSADAFNSYGSSHTHLSPSLRPSDANGAGAYPPSGLGPQQIGAPPSVVGGGIWGDIGSGRPSVSGAAGSSKAAPLPSQSFVHGGHDIWGSNSMWGRGSLVGDFGGGGGGFGGGQDLWNQPLGQGDGAPQHVASAWPTSFSQQGSHAYDPWGSKPR